MSENENNEKEATKRALTRRKWSYRIVSIIVILISIKICIAGHWEDIPVSFATVVLIIGVAIWMLGSPGDYNSGDNGVIMITMEEPKKIEDIYEAYRKIETPIGSCYLGKITTMKQQALIWGPNSEGEYLYFWLNDSGIVGYLGYSGLDGLISKHITEPDFPIKEVPEANKDIANKNIEEKNIEYKDIADNVTENNAVEENVIGENTTEDRKAEVKNVVYPVGIWTVQTQLHDSLKFYAEMGQALPLPDVQPAYEQEIKEFEESDSDKE